jgi:hypothetical protein
VYAKVLHGNGLAFTWRSAHPLSATTTMHEAAMPNRTTHCCECGQS